MGESSIGADTGFPSWSVKGTFEIRVAAFRVAAQQDVQQIFMAKYDRSPGMRGQPIIELFEP